ERSVLPESSRPGEFHPQPLNRVDPGRMEVDTTVPPTKGPSSNRTCSFPAYGLPTEFTCSFQRTVSARQFELGQSSHTFLPVPQMLSGSRACTDVDSCAGNT